MRNPNSFEKDELLRFFLYRMSTEQRNLLMATYPLHYAMLFPTVTKETIAFKVATQIEWVEEHSKDPIPNTSPVL